MTALLITHHFTDDILADYAAGGLGESWSLAVATHLALCPQCRATVRSFEALGGASLDEVEPVAMLSDVSALLDASPLDDAAIEVSATKPASTGVDTGELVFPEPLRSMIGAGPNDVPWRAIGGGIRQRILPTNDEATARLLFIPPGVATPAHSHQGMEYTLVLSGGFYDGDEAFVRGDVELTDRTTPHTPRAMEDQPCVTLAVTGAPLRFEKLTPRLFQPFLKI